MTWLWILIIGGWLLCGVGGYLCSRAVGRRDKITGWTVGDRTAALLLISFGPIILLLAGCMYLAEEVDRHDDRPAKW